MDEAFAVVATCRDLGEAEILKTKLEAEGIECWLDNKHITSLNWLYSDALGGIRIRVNSEDAKKALLILKSHPWKQPHYSHKKQKRSKLKLAIIWIILMPMLAGLLIVLINLFRTV